MENLFDLFRLDFVLRNSEYASLLLGAFVPLVGTFLVIDRKSILALALPQVSTLGVAAVIWVAAFCGLDVASHKSSALFLVLALVGSFAAMAGALAWQFFMEKRVHAPEDAETGAIYAVASAAIMALASTNLIPELGLLDVLRGEILAIPNALLLAEALGFVLIAGLLWLLARPLHFVLYDRTLAYASGLPANGLSILILVLIGATIALGGLCAGPLTVFAFLVLPPLAFLPFVRHMRSLYVLSSITGALCAFVGFGLSFWIESWSLPVPAAQIALLGLVWIASRCVGLVVRRPSAKRKSG